MTIHKTCTGPCRRTLPEDAEHFYCKPNKTGIYRPMCKDCIRALSRRTYNKNPAKAIAERWQRKLKARGVL